MAQEAHAAQRVEVQTRVTEKLEFFASNPDKRGFLHIVFDVKRVLGLTGDETVKKTNAAKTVQGDTTTKFMQLYKGIPVFNAHIVLSRDAKTGEIKERSHGEFIQKIDKDVKSTIAGLDPDDALENVKAREDDSMLQVTILNPKVEKYIYIEEETNKAHLAYFVSYTAVGSGKTKRPVYMMDANLGNVFFSYDDLETRYVEGVGGNAKLGRYHFGRHPQLKKLNVRASDDGKCHLENAHIRVYHMENKKLPLAPGSKPYSYDCNTMINDAVNGAYSPLYDAMYFGTRIFSLLSDWAGIPLLKVKPTPVLVHYGYRYQNAFWDGTHVGLGDGGDIFYPLSTFDIIAHEFAHGFTRENSGLIYWSMSGGINEAFSDMTGEAFELYLNFTPLDWMLGYYSTKRASPLRWFRTPSRDGHSIDRASQFDKHGPHSASGVYRKAFYHLAHKSSWGVKRVWQVAVRANAIYWHRSLTFDQGACGMEKAAEDLGFRVVDVREAFSIVEVSCQGGWRSYVKVLKPGVPIKNLSGAKGTRIYYELKLTSLAEKLIIFTVGNGDADIYVQKGKMPSLMTDPTRSCNINSSNEDVTIRDPDTGKCKLFFFCANTQRCIAVDGFYLTHY